MSALSAAKREVAEVGAQLRAAGLSPGTTGNVSVRVGERLIVTPTGGDLGMLRPRSLSVLGLSGERISGLPPTKEWAMHTALYGEHVGAVIHTHQTFATALSCLEELATGDGHTSTLPILTPYLSMRASPIEVVEYFRPGDAALGEALPVATSARARVILLRNHGAVAAANSLSEALTVLIELEEAAKVHFLTKGEAVRPLTAAHVSVLGGSAR